MIKIIAERYRIVKSLGEGGMADVYLAVDEILNREVAIKILRGDLSNDPISLLRFQREASAVSKLHHPNVVQIYDVGQWENRHYIVMEYIAGKNLKQLIKARGALDKVEAVDIMKQLTSAIIHAHENKLIHRDIKPQNVLIKADGTVKITDFGIALAHDNVQLTQSDSVLGSAHYIAPETTRGESASEQIDIYALGIVFYELLRGEPPYRGENPVQIAMMHLKEEITPITEFNSSIPQSIENIIIKACAKNKDLRYQSATEMLKDLNNCLLPAYVNQPKLVLESDTDVAETLVLERKTKESSPKQKEKSRTQTIIGVLLMMISVVALGVLILFSGLLLKEQIDEQQVVPDVSGMSLVEATNTLSELGFNVSTKVQEELSTSVEKGDVIRSEPFAEVELEVGSTIELIVSKGPPFVINDYVGMTIEEVEAELRTVNATIIKEYRPTSDYAFGVVMEQSGLKPGTEIDPTKPHTIKLVIASNPEFVIPNIKGDPIASAKAELEALGGQVELIKLSTDGMSEEEIAELEKGVVVDTNPGIGTLYIQNWNVKIAIYYYE